MNFLERVKRDLANERNRRGLRNEVVVDARALQQLLDDYDRIDTAYRTLVMSHNDEPDTFVYMEEAIAAHYHASGKDAGRTLLAASNMLLRLDAQKEKEDSLSVMYQSMDKWE